jgi:D-alanyl-D-alanine carboxypeptidase/D-alanyl-D-alanine-endopeptidase (penicillin-binding protein 4)
MFFRLLITFIACFTVITVGIAEGQISRPSASPTPMSSASALSPKNSLSELLAEIRERIARPELRRGQIGIKVVSLDSGRALFEQNAEKYFMPASNMKSFTVATALERLTPDYRFVTSIFAAEAPDASGTVNGDLRVFGRGDISISYSFHDGDFYKGMDRVADAIVSAGVRKIDGDLIGDETYFTGSPLPAGWEWDDLQWYYGAEVSALSVNDNVVSISVTPSSPGVPCNVRMTPPHLVMRVVNGCLTSSTGSPRTIRIHKPLDRNTIEISGDLPAGNTGFSGSVTVSRPAEMFVELLRSRLEQKGVKVTGRARPVNLKAAIPANLITEIARVESPPLALIAAKTMKPSQNMYTEVLLWTLGENARAMANTAGNRAPVVAGASADIGIGVVKQFLKDIGVAEDGVLQYDGSGLSRHNLITPESAVRLYSYMAKESRFAQAWRDSLTIGGVDGTLRNRFTGTRAAANVRGKTGTINQVSALSGYVTTAGGDQLVFSMIVNGVAVTRTRVELIDEIVVLLASFEGKID